jgi:hypothetical protein
VQQSPWLTVANRQMELMGRYMAEIGLTPASRSRIAISMQPVEERVDKIEFVVVYHDADGNRYERPLDDRTLVGAVDHSPVREDTVRRIELDGNL